MSVEIFPQVLSAPGKMVAPAIRMTPYNLADMEAELAGCQQDQRQPRNRELNLRAFVPDNGYEVALTDSGRAAITASLEWLGLRNEDQVLIVTTTQGRYISSCVTSAIESVCQWTRNWSSTVKAVLMIHEFGQPCGWPSDLPCPADLPIIEDRAYGIGLPFATLPRGGYPDCYIYSLSKSFPLPGGGLLACHAVRAQHAFRAGDYEHDIHSKHYLERRLPSLIDQIEADGLRRRRNDSEYRRVFAGIGLQALFAPDDRAIPHAFLFRLADEALGRTLKDALEARNVESSVYWGGGAYFLPNHPRVGVGVIAWLAETVAAVLRRHAR